MHVVNYDLPSTQYGGIEEYTHRIGKSCKPPSLETIDFLTFIGRTGRIGNMGLATSFYNDRDEDLAPSLVKTLLETRQTIPDFLESHIPEGFTADGLTGDLAKLKFEADSDDGMPHDPVLYRLTSASAMLIRYLEEEEAAAENGEGGTAAAAQPEVSWGAPAAETTAPADSWGVPAEEAPSKAAPADSWGAPAAGGDTWGSGGGSSW